jgi:hypothetical protein
MQGFNFRTHTFPEQLMQNDTIHLLISHMSITVCLSRVHNSSTTCYRYIKSFASPTDYQFGSYNVLRMRPNTTSSTSESHGLQRSGFKLRCILYPCDFDYMYADPRQDCSRVSASPDTLFVGRSQPARAFVDISFPPAYFSSISLRAALGIYRWPVGTLSELGILCNILGSPS